MVSKKQFNKTCGGALTHKLLRYSRAPKFGFRHFPKLSHSQTCSVFENRTLSFGYRMFGSFKLQRSVFGISAFFTKLDRLIKKHYI